ncbi:hypothetical protein PQ455_12940 [Sphingomonas naphthae]|uniref:Flagellar protein FlgN n=1 Tax=Sphingomonas naphthae TaxID=1813468 RepID=A0ABY7THK5_9SPHN|nr:hypothetical protein [Sphingomonas naphthae]WCT72538.1 hypothetical protein PQ455_12940 [Sphingomonas naphthae]
MSVTRRVIAQEVMDRLVSAERSTDQALIDTAELAATLLKARLKIEAAAEVGQDAFERIAATFAAHVEGRRSIVAAHQALAEVKVKMGLATVALGGGGDKEVPPQPEAVYAEPHLSLVRQAA